jgi:hypothetical protein
MVETQDTLLSVVSLAHYSDEEVEEKQADDDDQEEEKSDVESIPVTNRLHINSHSID